MRARIEAAVVWTVFGALIALAVVVGTVKEIRRVM